MASSLLEFKPKSLHGSMNQVDPLAPMPHPNLKHTIFETVPISSTSGSVGFGNTNVIFKLPSVGHVEEVYLSLDYAAGSSETLANSSFYLSAIKEVQLRIGSETVWRCNNYDQLLPCLLANLDDDVRGMFYGQAGTSSAAYAGNLIPIWTPWSRVMNKDQSISPLPAHLLASSEQIELTLSFATGSTLVTAGTVGTISGNIVIHRSLVKNPDMKSWSQKSVEIQEGASHASYTTTALRATETFSGCIMALFLYLATDAARSAGDYVTTVLPTDVKTYVSGIRVDTMSSANECLMRMLTTNGYNRNTHTTAGGGDAFLQYFSSSNAISAYGSGFDVRGSSTLEQEVTCAAASYGTWYALVHASYAINSEGMFVKRLA